MSDVYNDAYAQPGPRGYLNQLVLGGVIEAAVNWCTHNMRHRLNALGIPAAYDFQPTGTHSWGYRQEALKNSWPVLADGLACRTDGPAREGGQPAGSIPRLAFRESRRSAHERAILQRWKVRIPLLAMTGPISGRR
ncbi:hypothetical protein [Nocardia sp. NPDC057455]|uniref:hypothetical protein n=1 Tax=Nocardia sp. NPDC057455 TaxID=3346138 RepID=UPI00366B0CE7